MHIKMPKPVGIVDYYCTEPSVQDDPWTEGEVLGQHAHHEVRLLLPEVGGEE